MTFAIVGARIFDGDTIRDGQAVLVEGARIGSIVPRGDVPKGTKLHEVEGLLSPGFVDVQVNGGGGVLFNDAPSVDAIRTIGAAHRRFGTVGFLPTLISDTREKMAAAIDAVRDAMAERVPGLLGIHLEGPFLNPNRKGAHQAHFMRPVEDEDIRLMTSLEGRRTLVTLAPEMLPIGAIARLAEAGVIVAAGHTDASTDVLEEARKAGLRGYTHLFNAMPDLGKRAPGPVGAALEDREGWCSFIADFHHVAAPVLRIALRARGHERMILITDAMSPTGTDIRAFDLTGQTVYRRNGRLEFEDGTLAGADLDMAAAVKNVHTELRLDLATALRMASLNPAAFLRLDHEFGRIRRGYRASLVLLDEKSLRVQHTWIDGEEDD